MAATTEWVLPDNLTPRERMRALRLAQSTKAGEAQPVLANPDLKRT
jgi:hypothetical protein